MENNFAGKRTMECKQNKAFVSVCFCNNGSCSIWWATGASNDYHWHCAFELQI